MNNGNILLFATGLLVGVSLAYIAVQTKSFSKHRSLGVHPSADKIPVSPEQIDQWVENHLKNYREKLLGFYVNEQMRAHIAEFSEEQENQIVQEYGRIYTSPDLYVYRAFKDQFPQAAENELDKSLRAWLQTYPPQTGTIPFQIRKALEPEVKTEATQIINQKLKSFKE